MEEETYPEKEPSMADHPVLVDINKICSVIAEAEALVKRAKQQLHEAVAELPSKIGDNEELREEIIYHLYWFDDRIPKNTLKKAFDVVPPALAGKNSKNVIRPRPLPIICRDCKQESFVTLKSSREMHFHICDECDAKRKQESHDYFERTRIKEVRRRQRFHELATMPYYEYLQTPEWAERRRRAMKRAGFRCQVCNAYGVQLNVHHRTYEHRGDERDKDLITLCRTCHEIFHQNGQLAQG
jgi:Zn finger protein HypA/HybF involved in hydrogenase expression